MLHGLIIAGGKGERLGGVRKGALRIGGRRLLDRVAEALGPMPLMIASGPHGPMHLPGAMTVPDIDAPLAGPLAGLAASIAALQAQGISSGLLVSVAADTPFLPSDFATVMGAELGDAPAAFASWGGNFYPPDAIWRLEALADLPQQVMTGRAPTSPKGLHAALGARRVDWTDRCRADPFANVNTLADLLVLGRRARTQRPRSAPP